LTGFIVIRQFLEERNWSKVSSDRGTVFQAVSWKLRKRGVPERHFKKRHEVPQIYLTFSPSIFSHLPNFKNLCN
jgi:hypothetical protein